MGAPDPENPLFLGFSVLRGGLRPWSRKGPDHGGGVDPETAKLVNPDFLPPARCDFSHARKGKWLFQSKTLDKGHFPFPKNLLGYF